MVDAIWNAVLDIAHAAAWMLVGVFLACVIACVWLRSMAEKGRW